MKKVVMGIVESVPSAEGVVSRLRATGIPPADVSVLLPDKTGSRDFAHEHHTKAPEGTAAGVGAGGVVGGTLGLLAGIGALVVPGVGPLIAAGPVMAALSGAAAGAAVGGIAGALIGMGIPEIEAKHYEGKIRGGNVLVAVHTESAADQRIAEKVLRDAGAQNVSSTSEAHSPERSSSAEHR